MLSSESPLAQLDAELLIQEVKARPSLYAKDAPKYNDSSFKKILWDEIASTLFSNVWTNYSTDEKAEKSELVQRRWKNLRACFTRELKRQKDPQWIYGVSYKRRKYLYYNELSFLKSEFDKSNGEDEAPHDIDLPEKTGADNTTVTIDTNIEVTPIPDAVPIPSIPKYDSQSTPSTETSPPKNNESDSTNFALSIVPMLNMIPIEKRIDAHISILSILKKFLTEENVNTKSTVDQSVLKRLHKHKSKVKLIPIEIKSEAESDDDDTKYFN